MKPAGAARSVRLNDVPSRVVPAYGATVFMRVQAQGGDVSYRVDGHSEPVNGFILPEYSHLLINLSETESIFAWSTGSGVVRLVVQDYRHEQA